MPGDKPERPLLTQGGVWLNWTVAGLLAAMAGVGWRAWDGNDARLNVLEEADRVHTKWVEDRPDLTELVLLLEQVARHELLLRGPRWTSSQEAEYQREHEALHRTLREELQGVLGTLGEQHISEDELIAHLLDQIGALYRLDTQHSVRLRRIETVLDIYAGEEAPSAGYERQGP